MRVTKRIMVLTGSPNKDGLTAACGNAAAAGIAGAGLEVNRVDLNALKIARCSACGTGYGPCRTEHRCQVEDDFQDVHKRILECEGFVLVTPVYWGDMSESVKAFVDRLRRNEASKRDESGLKGKPCIGVAAAGGSGNGTITCLLNMQQFLNHVRADIFDLITITRKSRDYKLNAVRCAAEAMARLLS
ncbi:MAG TPA: flavodoxin family protein [Firmicutes bacterium]|nr:flavodoxin family protein [Candidatus Fermentithermobacillaceae bacterium]